MTTKLDIAKKVSNETNISMKDTLLFMDHLLFLIKKNLATRKVKINKFGSFAIHKTAKRIGRNPKTMESYDIPAANKVIFRASNKLKKHIN